MKKQVLDGQSLLPEKVYNQEKCDYCMKTPKPNILYSFDCENSSQRICFKCIQAKRRQSAHLFTSDDKIYIGTKKHSCGYGKSMFSQQLGRFHDKKGKLIYIPIYQCKTCGAYIVDGKTYEKNSSLLQQCVLINTKTGITLTKFTATERALRPQKKITTEVPDHLQWAIKHPYQGGGCSGK